ncbi:MAG: ATP phosphoribosyltransferase regulatory subunit [Acidobacteriota bacterium]
MRISAALPAGVTALFFEAAAARRALESRWVARLEAAGFSEALLPILDFADPYEVLLPTRGRGEVYRFVDRGGELLVLRADFTPMLARLLAPMLPGLDVPLRLFYRGDVVRCAEERPGRMREFYQLGAEWIGAPGAAGEAGEHEMLRRFLDLLAAGNGEDTRVVLGFAGALDELLLNCGQDPVALAAAVARRERGLARAADPVLAEVVECGVPVRSAALGSAAEKLDATLDLARVLRSEFPGLSVEVDLADFAGHVTDPRLAALMPGAAYYDGLMYRAYVGGATLPAGSGGRYDGLFRRLGADVSAAGFSLGLDRPAGGGLG